MQRFRKCVKTMTFGAATSGQRSIVYVTERAAFLLMPGKGIKLLRGCPGYQPEKDVLAHMEFRSTVGNFRLMDIKIFWQR